MAAKVPKTANSKKFNEDIIVVDNGSTPIEAFEEVVKADEAKVESMESNNSKPREYSNPEVEDAEQDELYHHDEVSGVSLFDTESAPRQVVKTVKVKTRVDHTCTIGGVRYFFTAGKQQNVPESVKEILLKAGLLSPL